MADMGVFANRESHEPRSWLNHRLADLVYLTHTVITIWVAIGWLGSEDWMLWGVIILYGSTEILWLTRSSYCILTDLERSLRGVPKPESVLEQNFVRRLFNLFLRTDITPEKAMLLTRIWGRIGFLVAFIRLLGPTLA
ncbi:MAG: hypothetical protein OR993_03065 [Candidatus Poseidoniales archaeon]|nr:hypothetical protein [Candidatus Poseidoniales archaeon]